MNVQNVHLQSLVVVFHCIYLISNSYSSINGFLQ